MQKSVYLVFSFFLLTLIYSQEYKKKYLVGYLDDDNITDILTYFIVNDVIKCNLKTNKFNLDFDFENSGLNYGFNNPEIGEICFISSGNGQTRLEEVLIYEFNSEILNWVLTKSITSSSQIDKKGGLEIPYISFEYSELNGKCTTLNDVEVNCKIIKPNENEIEKFLVDIKQKKNVKNKIIEYLYCYPVSKKNIQRYNDLAFYLNNNDLSLYILFNIIRIEPERTVAYLNIADNYYKLGNGVEAKKNYKKYIKLMKNQKKNVEKIPKYVYERVK